MQLVGVGYVVGYGWLRGWSIEAPCVVPVAVLALASTFAALALWATHGVVKRVCTSPYSLLLENNAHSRLGHV